MNKIKTLVLSLIAIGGISLASCSDEHMTEVNTDDTKTPVVNPNNLLTTSMLQTYGDFDMMDTYRCYITGFAQYYAGGWNVSNYAGSNMFNNEYSRKMWDKLYGVSIKNLVQGIEDYKDMKNINAVLRIYRVYLLSLIVDCYGDAPCKEAGYAAINKIYYPKYDTQKEAYQFFFSELKEAEKNLGTGTDKLTGDVSTMNNDIKAWKKFANSLRMRFAMRISDVEPEWAQKEFEEAIEGKNYIASAADNACVKYLNKSFTFYPGCEDLDFRVNALGEMLYGQAIDSPTLVAKTMYQYMQKMKDPRLYRICRNYINTTRSAVSASGCFDLTEELIAWGEKILADDPSATQYGVQPVDVGEFWWNSWPKVPEASDLPTLKRIAQENPEVQYDHQDYRARLTRPWLNLAFEQADCPGVLFTSAEAEFLLAEAKLKGWNVDDEVESHYEKGIRATMDFLNANYNIKPITKEEVDAYIADNPLGNNPKEAINTQAWLLHFTNPVEGWANQRRSDYPAMKDRASVPFGDGMKLGEDDLRVPARLRYPTLEEENNPDNFKAAINRQKDDKGVYSWHSRVWWDTKENNYYQ